MPQFMNRVGGYTFLLTTTKLFNAVAALAAIVLLIWSGAYIRKPGPTSYYSHFTGIYFTSCLLFQIIQFFLLVTGYTKAFGKRWYLVFAYIYWTTLALSAFICAASYSFTPKHDVIAVQFLSFFVGLTNIASLLYLHRNRPNEGLGQGSLDYGRPLQTKDNGTKNDVTTNELQGHSDGSEPPLSGLTSRRDGCRGRGSRCCFAFLRIFNRCLKFVHWAMSVMFIAGAITLALTYRYPNPGKHVPVKLPTGQIRALNYNCTTVPANGTLLPTFWFESTDAHGIGDFLGLQHFLALDHGRNSCSFDPPNYGSSDNLPANLLNTTDFFYPLVEALDKKNEEKIIVGWGGGGYSGLRHINENPSSIRAFVTLDTAPDGIEWYDLQRKNNWNEKQLLDYKKLDLDGRIFFTQVILTLGIAWGLMPIFIPNDSKGYFDQALYPFYHAQSCKEDFWALQYFSLLQMAAKPIDDYLVTATVPAGLPTFSIMTDVPGNTPEEKASNRYYKARKLDMMNRIAGGNMTKPPVWCTASDCTQGFPVDKPKLTADWLISFGI